MTHVEPKQAHYLNRNLHITYWMNLKYRLTESNRFRTNLKLFLGCTFVFRFLYYIYKIESLIVLQKTLFVTFLVLPICLLSQQAEVLVS